MAKQLQPTLGKVIRDKHNQGAVVPFPSGNNYRVQRPTAGQLLRRGDLPNPLMAFLLNVFYEGATPQKVDNFLATQERRESAVAVVDSFRIVCEAGFLEPRIVAQPQTDDEVTIDAIPEQDQAWWFRATFLGVDAFRPFPSQQETGVDSVPEVKDTPPQTE
jgi:hypothetical protein